MSIKLSTGCRKALLGVNDFKTLFNDCIMEIYSGSLPADPDADYSSNTKLATISLNAGAVTSGSATNCLSFDAPSGDTISKAAAETWQGTGLVGGTAGFCVILPNDFDNHGGADVSPWSKRRLFGDVGVGTGFLRMSSTSITGGQTITIDSCSFTLPES